MGEVLCRPQYLNGQEFLKEIVEETDEYVNIKITDRQGKTRFYKKNKSIRNSIINTRLK